VAAIDTVIFDIGNVLIRWDLRNLYRKVFADDAAIAAFVAETGLHAENAEFDRGKPFAVGLAELAARFPHHGTALHAFDERWSECLAGPIERNVAVLHDLKAAGGPVHAITNFSVEKFPIACGMFPFLNLFDDTVVSGSVRLIKPAPEIYRVLLERQMIDPRRAVFIDDSAANIATAASLGLHTVHVHDESVDLRRALKAIGVKGV
jgi:2-haloacid dehalogenase